MTRNPRLETSKKTAMRILHEETATRHMAMLKVETAVERVPTTKTVAYPLKPNASVKENPNQQILVHPW